jgi:hypothetical protein
MFPMLSGRRRTNGRPVRCSWWVSDPRPDRTGQWWLSDFAKISTRPPSRPERYYFPLLLLAPPPSPLTGPFGTVVVVEGGVGAGAWPCDPYVEPGLLPDA